MSSHWALLPPLGPSQETPLPSLWWHPTSGTLGISLFYCLYTLVTSLQNISKCRTYIFGKLWDFEYSSSAAELKRNRLSFCILRHPIFHWKPRFIHIYSRYPFPSPSKLMAVNSPWQGGKWMILSSKWRDQPPSGAGEGQTGTATGPADLEKQAWATTPWGWSLCWVFTQQTPMAPLQPLLSVR